MTHAPVDAARIREVGRIIYDEWNKSRGPGVAELCILWAEKTAAKILDAQGTAPEGHDEPCAFCGKPCSSLAGDPSQWPLGFAHPDGTGVCKWHHVGCVVERLFPAQGVAPAGWRPEGVDGLVQRDPAPCAARGAPTSGWRTMQTGGAPSPALHAPTVEACLPTELPDDARLKGHAALERVLGRMIHKPVIDDVWEAVRRALTGGAEAGPEPSATPQMDRLRERTKDCVNFKVDWGPEAHKLTPGERAAVLNDALDQAEEPGPDELPNEVEARDRAGAAVLDRKGASGNSDRGASAEPRPLSEWSDEELFRRLPKWEGTQEPNWHNSRGDELRSRGWRPWHGSDKAPVKGSVEVRLRNGGRLNARPARELRWKHHREFQQPDYPRDIIAYRPVPAKAERPCEACCGAYKYHGTKCERCPVKAEPTARFCWNCGTFQTDPRCNVCGVGVERTEPAADAGEVERLWSLAQGIEKSLETCGHVTLDNAEWTMVCTALRVAALRPAPTEEQVERAAWRVGSHYGIHIYEGETPIATALTPEFARQIVDEHNYGARAILAIGPAPQAGAGR